MFSAFAYSSVAFIIYDLKFVFQKSLGYSHDYFGAFSFCSPRMENGVLGNALEGVHVEEEEGEKTGEESLVENNDNIDGTWSCMWHSRDATYISCVHMTEIGFSLS